MVVYEGLVARYCSNVVREPLQQGLFEVLELYCSPFLDCLAVKLGAACLLSASSATACLLDLGNAAACATSMFILLRVKSRCATMSCCHGGMSIALLYLACFSAW
jgi:hypothetical protein